MWAVVTNKRVFVLEIIQRVASWAGVSADGFCQDGSSRTASRCIPGTAQLQSCQRFPATAFQHGKPLCPTLLCYSTP